MDQMLHMGELWCAMPLIFGPKYNAISKLTLIAIIGLPIIAGGMAVALTWSSYVTDTDVAHTQPIPFSHKHHVGQLGLDCRYCHTSVEKAASAGMPSTHTCMTCHSQIWQNSPLLKQVRDSYQKQKPISWIRVYRLPDFVYFNHSIHVKKGIGCVSCHGRVDQMPITWQHKAFYMRQCLECHRNPDNHIRPADEVFNMKWKAPSNEKVQNRLHPQRLTDCTTCHR